MGQGQTTWTCTKCNAIQQSATGSAPAVAGCTSTLQNPTPSGQHNWQQQQGTGG